MLAPANEIVCAERQHRHKTVELMLDRRSCGILASGGKWGGLFRLNKLCVCAERQHRRPAVEACSGTLCAILARSGEWGSLCRIRRLSIRLRRFGPLICAERQHRRLAVELSRWIWNSSPAIVDGVLYTVAGDVPSGPGLSPPGSNYCSGIARIYAFSLPSAATPICSCG